MVPMHKETFGAALELAFEAKVPLRPFWGASAGTERMFFTTLSAMNLKPDRLHWDWSVESDQSAHILFQMGFARSTSNLRGPHAIDTICVWEAT